MMWGGLRCDLCGRCTQHRMLVDGSLAPLCRPHGGVEVDKLERASETLRRYWERVERRGYREVIKTWGEWA